MILSYAQGFYLFFTLLCTVTADVQGVYDLGQLRLCVERAEWYFTG